MERLRDDALGYLLALSKADAILAMYLVNTTTTNAIMRVILQQVAPRQSHQSLWIRHTQPESPRCQWFEPAFQQMFRRGILLLDPHARGENRGQQVRILATAHLAAQHLQWFLTWICLYSSDILRQRTNLHMHTVIVPRRAVLCKNLLMRGAEMSQ